MGKIKEYLKMWLKPAMQNESLEEAISMSNLSSQDAKLLLETANGIKWTGYSEKEERKTKVNRKNEIKKVIPKMQVIESKNEQIKDDIDGRER